MTTHFNSLRTPVPPPKIPERHLEPPEDTPDGFPPIEHPEVTLRRLIRGLQTSGFVERVVHVARGAPLKKGEADRIRLIAREVMIPVMRLLIDVKKQRLAGKFGPEADPIEQDSLADLQDELDWMRTNDPNFARAKEARESGGLARDEG
jgi:hypothetical protein